jgi:hypothetical protein
VNSTLFLEYINNIFIHYLNELQESEDFARCEAVFIIDDYSLYTGDAVIAVLTRDRVRIITFASQTTHIFKMLDVMLFGAFQKHGIGLRTLEKQRPAAAFLLKVYHDFKQTMVEINIWDAFTAIEFAYDIEQNPYGLLFDEKKFRQTRGFAGSVSARCHWRVCRRDVENRNLDGSISQNKSIWSKYFAILPVRNEDMQPTI